MPNNHPVMADRRAPHGLYEPLTGRSIRLLRITKKGGNVRSPSFMPVYSCEMKTIALGDSIPIESQTGYTAISYTWQDASFNPSSWIGNLTTPNVRVHDKYLPQASRLLPMLRILYDFGFHDWIWIDAICINQEDRVERGHQVSFMKDIFSQASEVIIYLGGQYQRNFQGHPYWTRAWILQEVMFARRLAVVHDFERTPWTEFVQRHRMIDSSGEVHVPDLIGQLNLQRTYHVEDMLHTLDFTRGALCTDLRDAIYAKLGLCSEGSALVPFPDYEMSVEDVFTTFVKSWVEMKHSLYIICSAGDTTLELPSWTPDWSRQTGRSKISIAMRIVASNAISFYGREKMEASFSDDLDCLSVRGVKLDRVDIPKGARFEKSLVKHHSYETALERELAATNGRLRCICLRIQKDEPDDVLVGVVARTGSGSCAHVPEQVQDGDEVCIIYGCPVPVLLRRQPQGHHVLIGECYVADCLTSQAELKLPNYAALEPEKFEDTIFHLR